MILWSYSLGWDLSALWLIQRFLNLRSKSEATILVDERHLTIFRTCIEQLNSSIYFRLLGYPAGMTRGRRFEESVEIIDNYLQEIGLSSNEIVNLEHQVPQQCNQVACEIEGGLAIALHGQNAYFTPPRNLVDEIKSIIMRNWNLPKKPLFACGAYGKITTLKKIDEIARQQLGQRESVPLSLIASILTSVGSEYTSHFVSVDYRDRSIIEEEMSLVYSQVDSLLPYDCLHIAEIDHNQGDLIQIPCWYTALNEIAEEREGKFLVLTNRSNATHYAAILSPVVPIIILGPEGSIEWDVQAAQINQDPRRSSQKTVTNISGETWEIVQRQAESALNSILF
ncbi:MAG: hypothetical protein HEQ35_29895 [Gloeotrichia echinulata IR180]|nr:hypothetical protein [Gloeotrichia echinulata DEX184]